MLYRNSNFTFFASLSDLNDSGWAIWEEELSIGIQMERSLLLNRNGKMFQDILTKHIYRFYQQNGYLVIRNCVSEADIDRYYDRFKVGLSCLQS